MRTLLIFLTVAALGIASPDNMLISSANFRKSFDGIVPQELVGDGPEHRIKMPLELIKRKEIIIQAMHSYAVHSPEKKENIKKDTETTLQYLDSMKELSVEIVSLVKAYGLHPSGDFENAQVRMVEEIKIYRQEVMEQQHP